MDSTIDEIEGSQIGAALAADNGASPKYLTDLRINIFDIRTLVCNYCKEPTKGKRTREQFVKSLIAILTEANNQLTLYIEDLKHAKCIEHFCLSSQQDDDNHPFWRFVGKLCEEIRHEASCQTLECCISQFQSLLAEAENAKVYCNPIVFKEFFFRKRKVFSDENVVAYQFNRKLYKKKPNTIEKLRKMMVQAVIDALDSGIFDFADIPSKQDVNKVSPELLSDLLPYNFIVTDEFKLKYAQLRQFADKKGPMLVFDYEKYGQYILDNADMLDEDLLKAIFELDVMLGLIYNEMVRLEPELAKHLNKADDTNTFGIVNSLTRLIQQPWFKDFRTDAKYDHAWIEKFVSDLVASEYRQTLLEIWQDADKRLTLKGNIIGCLKMAGVIDGSDLGIAAALLNGSDKENKTFAIYMGKGWKMSFCDWTCDYVKH